MAVFAMGYVIKDQKKRKKIVNGWLRNCCYSDPALVPITLLRELKTDFLEDYKKFLCMDAENFDYILKGNI